MADRLVTHSPLGSPDTLRAFLQLSKRFYNLHTPRQFGYSDADALQYVGTSENFGSELFLESKKLKMYKSPSTFVNMNRPLISLFRVEASDYMDSYLQTGMRMCTPKPNVLNPAWQYKIEFSDVTEVVIPRAIHDGYGDGVEEEEPWDYDTGVYPTTFYVTTTPPKLKYYNGGENPFIEEDLIAGSDGSTKYYFPKNDITEKLITFTDTDVFLTENMVSYPELAWLYFTSNELITLPEVNMTDNVDRNGNPLVSIGTNGQASSFIYAGAYGETNLPIAESSGTSGIGVGDLIRIKQTAETYYNTQTTIPQWVKDTLWIVYDVDSTRIVVDSSEDGEQHIMSPFVPSDCELIRSAPIDPTRDVAGNWYILIYGAFIDCQDKESAYIYNTGVRITKIEYVLIPEDADPSNGWEGIDVLASHTITFDVDDKIIHICLLDVDNIYYQGPYKFQKIKEGVHGYDPNLLNQGYFTYFKFDKSFSTSQLGALLPVLRIKFAEEFFFKREADLNHFVSGVHLDYTTDYSDNSVPKKFGVIHSLGEFDGLPTYFKRYLDRTIHRAHVEMYAIRDDANNRNQKPMDKQTAAIILDSAVPQNEIKELTGIGIVITYAAEGSNDSIIQPKYVTNEKAIVSLDNYPSDIRFLSNDRFLDDQICTAEEREECPRFIYHGNGYFSLGYINFDPELETGRGYLITNDPAAYINNETSRNPKAERTAARICDIPTSFTQLLSVTGKSPTLLMDSQYIRMGAPVMLNRAIVAEDVQGEKHIILENDIHRLWNVNPSLRFTGLEGYTPYVQNLIVNNNPEVNRLKQTPFSSLASVRGNNGGFLWKHKDFQVFKVPSSEIMRVAKQAPMPYNASCKYYLDNGGSGYSIGDKIGFNIGGVYLKVDIINVDDGKITDYQFHMDTKYPGMNYDDYGTLTDVIPDVPLSNFDGQTTTFTTHTISGSGSGATFTFVLSDTIMSHYKPPQYDWQYGRMPYSPESQPPYADVLREGQYAISCDSWSNSVHINEVKSEITDENDVWDVDHRIQLTGFMGEMNPVYDDSDTAYKRKAFSSMMYHMLSDGKFVNVDMMDVVNHPAKYVKMTYRTIDYDPSAGFTYEGLRQGVDFSKLVSNQGLNQFGAFFGLVEKQDGVSIDSAKAYLLSYKFALDMLDTSQFPSYTDLNVSSFNIYTASLLMSQQYRFPFMYDIHSRSNHQYTDFGGFITRDYGSDLNFSDMISVVDNYPSDANLLYGSQLMNYPMYRITQIPRTIDPMAPYHITDVERISEIDITDIQILQYFINTAYTSGQLVYHDDDPEVYRVSEPFTSTTFESDVASGKLVYYSNRDNVSGHNYNELNKNTEYGGFIPLKDTYDDTAHVGMESYENNPLYVFRIDNTAFNYNTLDGFRMYDGTMDISEMTLLIINGRQYVFRDNKWEWNYHT